MRKLYKMIVITTASYAFAALEVAACSPTPPFPDMLLVGNKGENTVSFIDLESGEEYFQKIATGKNPHEIAIAPNSGFAAVVNYGEATINILSVASGGIRTTIDLGENSRPHGLVALSDGGFIATTEGGQSIVILSPNHDYSKFGSGACPLYNWTVEAIPTNQAGTHMIAVSPDERTAFTANMQSGSVSRIDLDTKSVLSVPAGKEVEGISVTRDGEEVWASIRGENKVIVFDTRTLEPLDEIAVGKFPLRIIVSPDGKNMVTSNLMDGSLSVIDVETRQVKRTIEVSGQPASAQVTILFSDDGSRLYAAETGTDTVAEIDFVSGKILRRLPAGRQGDGLAIVTGTQ